MQRHVAGAAPVASACPRPVDAGLGITDGHWRSFMEHLSVTMDELNIGGDGKTGVIAVFTGLNGDVVDQPEE
ncbi:MAG: hypothetical protein ACE5OQ_10195 [Woeseia sp.]